MGQRRYGEECDDVINYRNNSGTIQLLLAALFGTCGGARL